MHRRQLDLRLLRSFLQPLQGHLVVGEVDTFFVLEGLHEPVHDALVPVVSTEVGVARGRLHLEHTVSDLEDGHVERPTTEVEHEHGLVGRLLVEAVSKRRCGRLVDDAQHFEPGDLSRLFGGGALGVVEVRGDGDDRLIDGVTEVALCVSLQLLQDARGDLLGRIVLAVDVDGPRSAHVALHRPDRPVRIGDRLTFGDLTDEYLTGLRESDY